MVQGSRRRGRVFIYIALILLLGAVLVWALMRNQFTPAATQSPTAVPEEMVDIVVTSQTIARGTVITEAALTTIRYPKKEVVEGTFYSNPMEITGKRAKIDLAPRVPVTTSVVLETVEGSFAAFQVPPGMVAVSIPITRLSSVSFAPRPGDHVNIISTMMFVELDTEYQSRLPNQTAGVIGPGPDLVVGGADGESSSVMSLASGRESQSAQTISGGAGSPEGRSEVDTVLGKQMYVVPSEDQRPRVVSQTLLQDAIVLQLGNFALAEEEMAEQAVQPADDPAADPQADPEAAAPEPIEKPDLITVVVTPQDAVTLNYLLYNGAQLTLALRGAGDEQRVQTEAVTLQYLMDQYAIPVPAKLPFGMEPRLDVLTPPVLKNDAPAVTPQ